MSEGAFSEVRVIDLTHYIAGPFSTKLLADYGADVVKVEPPGGEGGRWLWPFKGNEPGLERSGTFAYLNTNKRGVVLNLKRADARAALLKLVETADLVVESYAPGTMDSLGLGYDALRRVNPSVSLLSVSNFGQTGPYRDWAGSEIVLFGMGGEMYSMGLADREPIKMGGTAAILQSGSAAAVAGAAAAFGRKTGLPSQHIDVAIFETLLTGVDRRHATINGYQFTGGRVTTRASAASFAGFAGGVFPCVDGYVEINAGGPGRSFDQVRIMLGRPPELAGPEFDDPAASLNPELKAIFDEVFFPWLFSHTKREIWAAGQEGHVLCAPLYTMDDVFTDPSLRERGFFVKTFKEGIGEFELPGRPFLMSESPWELRRAAPTLGQHTAEVLAEVGYSAADATRFASAEVA
ncbi:MAG TPA: CoA transferase [Tepidiformaceae bacterium]|nr:CoA transferase [Tepidiformaceae bacterium]